MIDSTLPFTWQQPCSIWEAKEKYEKLGWTTIPTHGKRPAYVGSWLATHSKDQWQYVGSSFAGNIGVVVDNGLVVIDADNQETAAAIDAGLQSLGLDPPTVRTPRGRHFYLKVDGVPDEFKVLELASECYKGEIRIRNSYVLAPCSRIGEKTYEWQKKLPEAWMDLEPLAWKALAWLVPNNRVPIPILESLPIRLHRREMPRQAKMLLEELTTASEGQPVDRYRTRSHAEAAVIAILILAGWHYDEILNIFNTYSPGKFRDSKGKDRQNYFDRTYHRVLSKIAAHPTRQEISLVWRGANENPYWPGASGFLLRDTYLGLLAKAWQFGSWEVSASERELAEYAAASQGRIHSALTRLIGDKFVMKLNKRRSRQEANRWKLHALKDVSSEAMTTDYSLREDVPYEIELWCPANLGRSAGTIYRLLGQVPLSIGQLSRQTGKAWGTVRKALKALEQFHLTARMESGWVRGTGSVSEVAERFDVSKAATRRRAYHMRQREWFAAWLARQQNSEKSK